MSYTTFTIHELKLAKPVISPSFKLDFEVIVTNTGARTGSEVVQAYITLPSTSLLTQPKYQLRAFAKARDVNLGESRKVSLTLDKYAVSYWDDRRYSWIAEAGEYTLSVGTSSDDRPLTATFTLGSSFTWVGL